MRHAERRRVLVRTFPPSSNPNYGGILQAWALQQVLGRMGIDSAVDKTRPERWRSGREIVSHRAKLCVLNAIPTRLLPSSVGGWATRASANKSILRFASRHITEVSLFSSAERVDQRIMDSFDGYIAGSDQVWRPDYVDIGKYLFDFLPESFDGPRVAYAASFGSDSPVFTEDLRAQTTDLARRLTAVSVREESGVQLCRDLWGVQAVRLVDPTMLLEPADYVALAAPAPGLSNLRNARYVLDEDDDKGRVVAALEARLGSEFTDTYLPLPSSYADYRRSRRAYDRLTVPEWIRTLATAPFVVTDSFHGTVFSILFERPFATLPNRSRGNARLESLLELFGLTGRLVSSPDEAVALVDQPIDWVAVRATLESERQKALQFLREALA